MNSSQARIELFIDVFEQAGQRALALSELKPAQLVAAILQEFHALEYLGDSADAYYLVRAATGEPLDAESTLDQQQVQKGDLLVLMERELPLPEGTRRPSVPIYLREPYEARTYPLQWLPAIIGRRSENRPHNELVAVDLSSYASGPRVSRRHVQLTEAAAGFFVQNLLSNPVSLLSPGRWSGAIPVTAAPQKILHNDIIRLDRSEIELKFIVRPTAPAPAPDANEAAPEGEEAQGAQQ